MKILFLDQSGKPGGAELSLMDIAKSCGEGSLVGLFADGLFREMLETQQIPVQVLSEQAIAIQKESGLFKGMASFGQLIPLIMQISKLARHYDLLYANTAKAFVLGALASALSKRPLVYHLRDMISPDHFSWVNRQLMVTLANQFAARVITNSQATQTAFVEAGGNRNLTQVIYNGFDLQQYCDDSGKPLTPSLDIPKKGWIIGHFSRLSPWKGQHVLIEALAHCPDDVYAILVGDALFGEQEYARDLHQQVHKLGLEDRVKFLGFRSDVPELMSACDLIVHTSIAPEPFGRVIVEAMLCGCPVIAAKAGGAMELVEHGVTGWLCPPSHPRQLADVIMASRQSLDQTQAIAQKAQALAKQRFNLEQTNQQVMAQLQQVVQQREQRSKRVTSDVPL